MESRPLSNRLLGLFSTSMYFGSAQCILQHTHPRRIRQSNRRIDYYDSYEESGMHVVRRFIDFGVYLREWSDQKGSFPWTMSCRSAQPDAGDGQALRHLQESIPGFGEGLVHFFMGGIGVESQDGDGPKSPSYRRFHERGRRGRLASIYQQRQTTWKERSYM